MLAACFASSPSSYRSLRDLRLSLGRLTVITGDNGVGKSNVYRGLRLLVDAADGQLGRALAREGAMPSVLWAGPPSKRAPKGEARRLSIGFADDVVAYELRLGLAPMSATAFNLDPFVKQETIRTIGKPQVNLLERRNQAAMLRDYDGRPVTFGATIDSANPCCLSSPSRTATRCCRRCASGSGAGGSITRSAPTLIPPCGPCRSAPAPRC